MAFLNFCTIQKPQSELSLLALPVALPGEQDLKLKSMVRKTSVFVKSALSVESQFYHPFYSEKPFTNKLSQEI